MASSTETVGVELTDEQKERVEANRRKALAIRAAKAERSTFPFDIVGRSASRYAHVPLTPTVPINVTPDKGNPYDKNAHRAWAYLNESWVQVGFVDRCNAASLAKFDIKLHSARVVGDTTATVVVKARA